jgi:MarR family 2-MHQ and catechol resistance regulon transcriptional repressor
MVRLRDEGSAVRVESQRYRGLREKVESMRDKVDGDYLLIGECGISLHDAFHSMHEAMNDWLAGYKLSMAKFDLLSLLAYRTPDHQLPMAEIGARMCVTGANVTGLVDGLERQGFVRRANLPGDRRVVLAQVTEAGMALIDDITPKHHEHMRSLWSELNDAEIQQLTSLLTRLTHSFEATKLLNQTNSTDEE